MGQAVVPWESQERCSLYLPHPHLPIVHSIRGISCLPYLAFVPTLIFAPSPMVVLYSYGSRQSNPLYLDTIVSIFFVLLFFSVIPLYLLSLPIMRHTYTYLSTTFVVRHLLAFLFSLFFSLSLRFGYANRSSLSEEFPPTMLLILCQIKLCISLPSKHAMFATSYLYRSFPFQPSV